MSTKHWELTAKDLTHFTGRESSVQGENLQLSIKNIAIGRESQTERDRKRETETEREAHGEGTQ